MKFMTLIVVLVAAFAVGGALALATDGTPASTTSLTTPTTVDVSGPCDEAEHANDPRCTGTAPVSSSGPGPGADDRGGNSGPGGGDDDGSGRSGRDGSDDD